MQIGISPQPVVALIAGILILLGPRLLSYMEEKHGYDTDRYFDSLPRRRTAHLASQ